MRQGGDIPDSGRPRARAPSRRGHLRLAPDDTADLAASANGALIPIAPGRALSGATGGANAGEIPLRVEDVASGGADDAWRQAAAPAAGKSRRLESNARLAQLERDGVETLSTRELIEIVSGGADGQADASHVASTIDLAAVSRRDARDLAREFSLSRAAAARLCAAFALGRRVERSVRAPRVPLRAPKLVHDLMAGELRGLERETFHALLLDGKHRLQSRRRISEGTLTTSLVHPREVFAPAVREGAAALIVVHNHPSGDPDPSPEDIAVTRRLIDVGALLGVPLLDHVVIAGDRYVSLRERMRFDAS